MNNVEQTEKQVLSYAMKNNLKVLNCKLIKSYFENPFYYNDLARIDYYNTQEGKKYIVYYSPTGSQFVFNTWNQALSYRSMLVNRWENLSEFPQEINVFNQKHVTIFNDKMIFGVIASRWIDEMINGNFQSCKEMLA